MFRNRPRQASVGRGMALIAIVMSLAVVLPAGVLAAPKPKPAPVDLQFLNVSDWHGQLDPINISGVGNVGGAAAISSYWKADRLANPNTLTLTAGDDFGATPPLSGFFDEVPAVLAQRLMGIQVGTLGNHNFDRGITHLQAMIDLAGAPSDDEPGTPYSYVSANLADRDENISGVEDFEIFTVGGVQVGVVGITNPEAPTLVFPGSFGTMVPTDPYSAANKARAAAKKAGAEVVVAIIHAGVRGFDTNGQPFGELVDFANNVGGFDVIFGDHTDIEFSGVINGQLVVENRSKGIRYAKTTLTFNPANGKVTDRAVQFVTPLASAVTPDSAIVSMLAPYRTQLSARLDGTIGVATASFPRGNSFERSGESALGDLIADGMRWRYGTQLALMNGGGIRKALPSDYAPADTSLRRPAAGYAAGPPFDVVTGDVYSILPFGNIVTTRTVTGSQLWAALENGVSKINAGTGLGADGRFPQISGFDFTFDYGNPSGCSGNELPANGPITWTCVPSRVVAVSLDDGTPILPDSTTYTLALPNFVNAGGDSYFVFADGQGVTREVDADVMLAYIDEVGPTLTPTLDGRIAKQP